MRGHIPKEQGEHRRYGLHCLERAAVGQMVGPPQYKDRESPRETPADEVKPDVDSWMVRAVKEEDTDSTYGPEYGPGVLLVSLAD